MFGSNGGMFGFTIGNPKYLGGLGCSSGPSRSEPPHPGSNG